MGEDHVGEAIDRIEAAGWAAVVYTTFSDNGTESDVSRDEVLTKMDLNRDPTIKELRTFLRDHYTSYLTPEIISSAEIVDAARHTSKGVRIVFSHVPREKYRIVFFLRETLKIMDLAGTHKAALEVFADMVRGLAQIAGIHTDPACTDPSRLFYLPRHPEGSEPYTCVIRGRGITADDIPRVADPNKKGRAKSGPVLTPLGKDLRRYPREKMALGTFLEAEAPDIVRGSDGDKVFAACPNEPRHSDGNDTDAFAKDGDGDGEKAVWHCSHGGCQAEGTLERIAAAMEAEIIDEELFFLPECEGGAMIVGDDELPDDGGATSAVAFDQDLDITGPLGSDLDEAIETLGKRFKAVNIGGDLSFVRVPDFAVEDESRMEVWSTPALIRFHDDRKVFVDTEKNGKKGSELVNPVVVFAAQAKRHSRLTFAPPPASKPKSALNLFCGFHLEPREGDCSDLKAFIRDVICAGDPDVFKWVWHWLAHMLQRPGEKPNTALVLHGPGGAGKGTFGELIQRLVYPYSMLANDREHVLGRFAGPMLVNSILCVCEEAFFAGDLRDADKLKSKVSAPTETVEQKNVPALKMRSHTRFILDSNREHVVNIENNGSERRFCVLKVCGDKAGNLAYFERLYAQIDGPELAALAWELLHYNPANAGMKWKDVRVAPETDARKAMGYHSRNQAERTLLTLIEEGRFEGRGSDGEFMYELADTERTRVPAQHMRDFLRPVVNKHDAASGDPVAMAKVLFGPTHGIEKSKGLVEVFGEANSKNRAYYEFPAMEGLRALAREKGYLQ